MTADHDALRGADGLVLPGVGAFPKAIRSLRERELDVLLGERLAAGVPVLGICLGMQLLFEASSENEGAWGLGLLPGRVERLPAPGLKVPHIGWNTVTWTRRSSSSRVSPTRRRSTSCTPTPRSCRPARTCSASAVYGGQFVCAVERPPLFGFQFHPEKSSADGLCLLRNFAGICTRAASASSPA